MMKKITGFAFLGAAASLALSFAFAQPVPDLPAGVGANNWISLGPDAGFVIVQGGANQADRSAGSYVHGYLMARRGGRWLRLEPEAPSGRLSPTFN